MATTLEVIRAIAQAAANTSDGAIDENGEPVKIGLRREKEVAITGPRLIDGFKVSFMGNALCLKYQSELTLKETHNKNFESDIDSTLADVVSFLKKEYKKIMDENLTLTKEGETSMMVQSTSRIRVWVEANAKYKIGNLKDVEALNEPSEERLNDSIKKFLAIGKDKYPSTPKPENVSIKK